MIDLFFDQYLYSTITWLINALIVGILFQQNAQRFYAACVFSGITYAHELLMSNADGLMYYASAALFDLLIVIVLGMIAPLPKMVLRLQIISFGFVLVNFLGWIMWYAYQPAVLYDCLCAILFSLSFITLLLRDKKDVGGFTMDGWRSCFRINRASLLFYTLKHEKKV